jgi:hypothetical protein
LLILPDQMIELIRAIMLPKRAQKMKMSIPEFLALTCHGAGRSKRTTERPLNTANASSRIVARAKTSWGRLRRVERSAVRFKGSVATFGKCK